MLKATREAYGEALAELGAKNKDVVALDADLSGSTKSAVFAKKFPERFFNMGIAEADLIGTATGLAISGKIAFASTFAVFATGRCYDQIRVSVAYPKTNVKIVGSHSGLMTGEDGASHQATEDIALMRAMPNMYLANPADAAEAHDAVFKSAEHKGPVYIRLCRAKTPLLEETQKFEFGKASVLEDGKDATIFATGVMVYGALEARAALKKKNLDIGVVNVASIKPLDEGLIVKLAKSTGAVITAEDHSIIGGLGGAVAETLSEKAPTPMERVGVRDVFAESGKPADLFHKYGLSTDSIVKYVEKACGKKK